jgi:hypothetical protein
MTISDIFHRHTSVRNEVFYYHSFMDYAYPNHVSHLRQETM